MRAKRADADGISELYQRRFGAAERARKNALWKVLCSRFLQRYVGADETVVDIGAGFGEFINNIRCGAKYAVDLNADTAAALDPDVTFLQRGAYSLPELQDASVDLVFASNVFEHVPSKDELLATLREIGRILRDGGKLLVLQPNIRYAYREYWDFFDHHIALSHESLAEALEMTGFQVDEMRPRFLPYTTKSRLPQHPALLWAYLHLPPLQWLLGKQLFALAVKRPGAPALVR